MDPADLLRGRVTRHGLGLVYFLAKYADLTVNGQSQCILTILVIGAGTDYALLLVARYREELRRHEDRHEAMAFALHRAAPAILASAATVVVGMLCLLFAEMNSTAGLGPVTAIGVAVTFLVMVTLLPALLVIFGRWIFWPIAPDLRHRPSPPSPASGPRSAGGSRSARARCGSVTVGAAGWWPASACSRSTPTAWPREEQYTKDFESVVGQKVLVEHDLVDTSNTVMVVANDDEAEDVREAMAGVEGAR